MTTANYIRQLTETLCNCAYHTWSGIYAKWKRLPVFRIAIGVCRHYQSSGADPITQRTNNRVGPAGNLATRRERTVNEECVRLDFAKALKRISDINIVKPRLESLRIIEEVSNDFQFDESLAKFTLTNRNRSSSAILLASCVTASCRIAMKSQPPNFSTIGW
jgi:hypothetical protein